MYGQSKRCHGCNRTLLLEEFSRDIKGTDGRRASCKSCLAEWNRQYHEVNRDKAAARQRKYLAESPEKFSRRTKARKKRIERQTPPWVDRAEIEEFYLYRPAGHHVDHIIPLLGITEEGYQVSGLHVVWNLQYLPARDNHAKANRCRQEDGEYFDGYSIEDPPDEPD
jgi:hypothetical protein